MGTTGEMVFGVTGDDAAGIADDEDIGPTEELETTGIGELETGTGPIVIVGGMDEELEIGVMDSIETCVEAELVVSIGDDGDVGDAK